MSPEDREDWLRAQWFGTVVPTDRLPHAADFGVSRLDFTTTLYRQILALLDARPHTLEELEMSVDAPPAEVRNATVLLTAGGAARAFAGPARHQPLSRFNRAVIERDWASQAHLSLMSPVTGGAVSVSFVPGLLLLALDEVPADDGDRAVLERALPSSWPTPI